MTTTICIDLDRKCQACGKAGATAGGLCLPCISAGIRRGEYDHILKPVPSPAPLGEVIKRMRTVIDEINLEGAASGDPG